MVCIKALKFEGCERILCKSNEVNGDMDQSLGEMSQKAANGHVSCTDLAGPAVTALWPKGLSLSPGFFSLPKNLQLGSFDSMTPSFCFQGKDVNYFSSGMLAKKKICSNSLVTMNLRIKEMNSW